MAQLKRTTRERQVQIKKPPSLKPSPVSRLEEGIRERPPALIQHVLTVLVFGSWVLLLPRLPPSSRSLRLFPWASILLHGSMGICLDLLPATPLLPVQKQDAQEARADFWSAAMIWGGASLRGEETYQRAHLPINWTLAPKKQSNDTLGRGFGRCTRRREVQNLLGDMSSVRFSRPLFPPPHGVL